MRKDSAPLTVHFAEAVAAPDERDRLEVVHAHAAKGAADVGHGLFGDGLPQHALCAAAAAAARDARLCTREVCALDACARSARPRVGRMPGAEPARQAQQQPRGGCPPPHQGFSINPPKGSPATHQG
jgi:hypothetical protein